MWALGILVLSVWLGWAILRLASLKVHRLEAAAISVAIGLNSMAWLFFLAILALGYTAGMVVALLLAAGLIRGLPYLGRDQLIVISSPYSKRLRLLQWGTAAATALIVGHIVVLSYQFPTATGAFVSNGNVWGDGPLHVGLTNQFAHGTTLDLTSPIYQKVTLAYPFLSDFYSGILLRVSGSWLLALMLPSLLMMLALMQLIWSFGYRLLRSVYGAWLQYLMLVFSGSLRGGWMLSNVLATKGMAAYTATVGTSLAFATGDNYLNFFHSHPLPQRSYLFGMAQLIVIMIIGLELYRRRAQSNARANLKRLGALGGVLLGMLPLIHTHSFLLAVGLVALSTALMVAAHTRLSAGYLQLLGIGAALAAPQMLWQFTTTYDGHFNHWIWGWMMQNFSPIHTNWLLFWSLNVGALFLVILFGWLGLWRTKAPGEVWALYLAGAVIFGVCNVYVFQPSQWDNMKFFEYAFWFQMLTLAYLLTKWRRYLIGKIVTAVLMLSLCTMGFYTLVLSGPALTFELLSVSEVHFGNDMRATLPANAYILVGDRHNHPITMLADRKVLMSYAGWYNLYHADWPAVYADRTTMLAGGANAVGLIQQYGLTHAVFADAEVYSGTANLSFYQEHYSLVKYEDGWWVFDLKDMQ